MNKTTRALLSLLIPCLSLLFLISCEDYSEKLTGTNPEGTAIDVSNRITGFSPEFAGAASELTVLGNSLSKVTMIYFGGFWIDDFSATETQVVFTVPANVAIGENEITLVFQGSERAATSVEVIPLPFISYFTPKAAAAGEVVTVMGNNLSYVTSLSVGATEASITQKDNNEITFTMPAGAQTGTINVTNSGGSTTSSSGSIISCTAEPGSLACLPVVNTNGSFEDSNLGEANGVAGWGGLTGSLAPGIITDEDFYDGFKSVKITINELGANPWNIQPNSAMTIDPNATYHLSVWVKGTGVANVKFAMDQGGTPGWSEWQAPEVSLTSNQWTQISYEFSPTSEDPGAGGDASVRFAVSMSYSGNVGGVMYMDNLRVVKLE